MTHSISLRSLVLPAAMVTAGLLSGCRSTAAAPADSPVAPLRASTFDPTVPLSRADQQWVERTLASLSLRERVAQMVMVWVLGDYANAQDPAFANIRKFVTDEKIGGVIMSLGSPGEVASKVNALQRAATVPLLVASDLEPGLGRLEGGYFVPSLISGGSATVLPSNMAIAATGREEHALEAGRIVGREARAIGIHMAFAPTVDVNNNPANPVINVRSFGEDPVRVARLSALFIRGVQESGTAATVKHFPGHGDTDTDSHLALPVVRSDRARLDQVELVPFRAAVAGGVAGVMTAHIALPAVEGDSTPATLAPAIIGELLRDTLGFRGLTVTDAMTMEGVGKGYTAEQSSVLAVQAGADVLLMPSSVPRTIGAVVAAVERGEITPDRIERSVRRILEVKARAGAHRRSAVVMDELREVVGAPAHWEEARAIAREAVTLLRDTDSLVPAAARARIVAVIYAPETEVVAGRAFTAELRELAPRARVVRISPVTPVAQLDSLLRLAADTGVRLIITTNVRTIEGEGRPAIPPHVSAWVDRAAASARTIVIANGNPYVLRQFPSVRSYMVTFGINPLLERAAAQAVLGRAPITGTSPITLPGLFARGDGLRRTGAP